MPRQLAILPLALSALLSAVAQAQTPVLRPPDAVLTAVRNQVSLEGPETGPARQGDPLRRGYRVRTGDGAVAEITFNDGTRGQLLERSLLVVAGEDAGSDHPRANDTTLLHGRLHVHIDQPLPGHAPLVVVVATPDAQVRMEPGDGILEFDEARGTRAEVQQGEWRVRARGQEVHVVPGYAARVEIGAAPAAPESVTAGTSAAAVLPPPSPPPPVATAEDIRQLQDQYHLLRLELDRLKAQQPMVPPPPPPAPSAAPAPSEPFAWGDFTWVNGGSRQASRLIDTKYFTPQVDIDANYTYSFNHPIDDTIVGSTATARHNELTLAFLGFGGDMHIGNVRGRLFTQFGTRSIVVPRNDVTPNRGQTNLEDVYRYLSEAYAGYHWDVLHGINLDVGLFFSYVGLFSYTQFENWGYQASFTSDNTPWFFNGARLQIFFTDRLKLELWAINGWQTYGKFNELPGFGYQIHYAPWESMSFVFNGYVGTDTQDHPGRVRFHSDNSYLLRYYNRPNSSGISRAAISVTFDLGFEQGGGVAAFHGRTKAHDTDPDFGTMAGGQACTDTHPCEQDFVSGMAYNMVWFWKNRLGWMAGGGFIHNPGRYLVLVPTGIAAATFDTSGGTTFDGYDLSSNVSWFAGDNLTFRLEGSYHNVSTPYYAGPGGVTGPDGYKCGGLTSPDNVIATCTPGMGQPASWTPDLVKTEFKLIFALLFRL